MAQQRAWYARHGTTCEDARGSSPTRTPTQNTAFVRSGDDLVDGFFVELEGWNWHMFRIDPITDHLPMGEPMRWGKAALLAAAAMGSAAAVQQVLTVRDRRRYPAPGLLVHVDGRQIHLQVRGADSAGPTVVLEAGMGSFSPNWHWVQEELAPMVRSVSLRPCRARLEPAQPPSPGCPDHCDGTAGCAARGRDRAAVRARRPFLRRHAGPRFRRSLSRADRWVGSGRCISSRPVGALADAARGQDA